MVKDFKGKLHVDDILDLDKWFETVPSGFWPFNPPSSGHGTNTEIGYPASNPGYSNPGKGKKNNRY